VRDQIEKYLGTVMQSTAKTIAERIGMDRLHVSRELNAMVSEGILERKLEGTGPRHTEYHYWLTRKDVVEPTADTATSPRKTFVGAIVSAAIAASPKVEKPEVTDAELSTVEEALDLTLQLQAVTRERDELREQHNNAVQCWGSYRDLYNAECDKHRETTAERDAALAEVRSQKEVIAKLRANNAALERKIDELTLVDAEFVPSQVFVTIGRYAAPKRHRTLEKAQRRANLLVRTEKESEVLVLEPVGRVVRGAEWRSQ